MHSALKFFIVLFALTLVACGSSNGVDTDTPQGNSVHVGNLPEFFFSELGDGTLRATLEVYGPDGALAYSENLQINETTGEIFSSQFNLPTGFTYTFIVTFFFQPTGGTELPVGFVVKIASTEGGSLALFWEESEVMTSNGQLSPDISASMSTSNLPNLDADGDGYDNFSEFREGSDPTDPNSIPLPPEMVGAPEIIHQEDYVEFNVTFKDASGISKIAPVDPYVCGFYEWTLTNVTPDGKTQQLHAMFNLHAYASLGGEITFKIQATDVLGLSEVYEVTVTGIAKNALSASDPLNKPEIAIITPNAGETVSDFVEINAKACDENGIGTFSVQGLPTTVVPGTDPDVFQGTLDTSALGDGPQNITLVATDTSTPSTYSNAKTVQVIIANQNPIKIDYPQPGSILVDGFTVAAHVDKRLMPSVANLFIESIKDEAGKEISAFNLLKFDVNTLPEAFTGQIFETSQIKNKTFTINYVAVGSDGQREARSVTYTINNYPVVKKFQVWGAPNLNACLSGGDVKVEWLVDNMEGGEVTILAFKSPDSQGTTVVDCLPALALTATRIGYDYRTGGDKTYLTSADLNLSVLGVAPFSVDEGIDPNAFQMTFTGTSGIDPTLLRWRVTLTDETQGITWVPFVAVGTSIGSPAPLAPRTDYSAQVELLNTAGNPVSGPVEVTFTTGEDNLVGWYRFDNAGSLGLDFTNPHNNGSALGSLSSSADSVIGNSAQFNGAAALQVSGFPATPSLTLDLWVNWDGSISDGVIIHKGEEFELEVEGGKLFFNLWDKSATPPEIKRVNIDTAPLFANTWYHVIATYDAGAVGNKQKLIVDGSTPVADTGPVTLNQNNINPVYLGWDGGGGLPLFKGLLDEVAIYDQVN